MLGPPACRPSAIVLLGSDFEVLGRDSETYTDIVHRRGRATVRVFLAACLAIASVILPSRQAFAYGTDVHFNLTYVEARLAGLRYRDALWVAFADESIDHNRATAAYSGTIDTLLQFVGVHRYTWARNGERWQAYTDIGTPNNALNGVMTTTHYSNPAEARAEIAKRREALWGDALAAQSRMIPGDRATTIRADIALGVCLHFVQDAYAHRQFGQDLDGQDWSPFGTFRGHSAEGYSSDYVDLRPHLAQEMLNTTYALLQQWQQRRGGKATELSPTLASALISHMSEAYDPRAMQYPEHRFRPWFPAQKKLDRELMMALTANGASHEWATTLPNANDLKYQLPYDSPATPLRDVEQRIGEPLLSNAHVPFSAVLPSEIAQP